MLHCMVKQRDGQPWVCTHGVPGADWRLVLSAHHAQKLTRAKSKQRSTSTRPRSLQKEARFRGEVVETRLVQEKKLVFIRGGGCCPHV